MMKNVRSDENYKIFLENEEKMASVFGVIHLCYAKRSNADTPTIPYFAKCHDSDHLYPCSQCVH